MKKLFFSVLIVTIVTNFTHKLNAQNFSSLDKSPMDVSVFPSSHRESNKLVKVTYSRPFLKGRSVSSLAPNGKVWRTGANEAVEIRFYKDVVFGGKEVKKGISNFMKANNVNIVYTSGENHIRRSSLFENPYIIIN